MWTCPKCNETTEDDDWLKCWKCGSPKDADTDANDPGASHEAIKEEVSPIFEPSNMFKRKVAVILSPIVGITLFRMFRYKVGFHKMGNAGIPLAKMSIWLCELILFMGIVLYVWTIASHLRKKGKAGFLYLVLGFIASAIAGFTLFNLFIRYNL